MAYYELSCRYDIENIIELLLVCMCSYSVTDHIQHTAAQQNVHGHFLVAVVVCFRLDLFTLLTRASARGPVYTGGMNGSTVHEKCCHHYYPPLSERENWFEAASVLFWAGIRKVTKRSPIPVTMVGVF